LAAIKFGEIAGNCLDKCFANLKFGDSHDHIESYDGYAYLHFSLVATRSQKMETYEVDSCVHGHHVCRLYSHCRDKEYDLLGHWLLL